MTRAFLERLADWFPDETLFADDVRLGRRGVMGRTEAVAELKKLKSDYRKVACRADGDKVTAKPGARADAFKVSFTAACDFIADGGKTTSERFPLEIEVASSGGRDRIAGLWSPERMVLWQPRAK